LKFLGSTPFSMRYCPAGILEGMAPAGEMWSVVTESPTLTSTRAPSMSLRSSGSGLMPLKKEGSWMYVESGSHS
jgi:hypothetical protein